MARLGHAPIGFELQSNTNGVEAETFSGTQSISTSQKYGGLASLRCNPTTAQGYVQHSPRADSTNNFYAKFMVYIAGAPSANAGLFWYGDSGNFYGYKLRLNTNRTLSVTDELATNVTTGSTVLALNTWYRIEVFCDEALDQMTVKIAVGDAAATTEINAAATEDEGGGGRVRIGVLDNATADIYIDDIAFSDSGYLGAGRVVAALLTGAGDNAPTTGLYSYINEIPPSDTATSGSTMIELDSNGVIADYNITNPNVLGIGSGDAINAVAVVVRAREEAAGTSSYNLRIKSASGGTVNATSNTDAGNATARTNPSGTTAFGKPLYTVVDPTTGVAWTPYGTNSLKNAQIGVASADADSTPDLWVLGLWAMVEYVPLSTNAKLETLTDRLRGAGLDTSKWNEFTAGGATMSYGSNGAKVNFPSSSTSATDGDLTSDNAYTLLESYAYMRVPTVPAAGTNADAIMAVAEVGGNGHMLRWVYEAGTIYAQWLADYSPTTLFSVAHNPSTHAYWRIREAAGTVYFDTGVDNGDGTVTWTNRASVARPIPLNNVLAFLVGACYQNETNPGAFEFSNFNDSSLLPTGQNFFF